MGASEAAYCGVATVATPMFGDQVFIINFSLILVCSQIQIFFSF